MLALHDVSVQYPDGPRALDRVSLRLVPGIFGLLGPNGAGKSTLLRVLATLQAPSSGTIAWQPDGPSGATIDVLATPQPLRTQLGYLPQEFGLYPTLSVEMTLDHFCALKGATDRAVRAQWVETLLDRTNLLEKRRAAVGALSGGMRQRLGLAIALAGHPKVLLLDEPTAGLDPGERRRMYDVLATVGAEVIVLLSTHLIEDVRAVCPQFGILHRGVLRALGSPAEAAGAGSLEDVYFAHVPLDDAR
ncbi:MAG: ATP-binding cassette domain-containing protein [Gemmatimonadaceae bacterium]|nr:ATP-binding cassette domain-containing protein [Gemmatimonadaceae bacterium]